MFRARLWGLLLIFSFCFPGLLLGQVNTGTILGNVIDPAGAKIVGARVTAVNHDTGFTRSAETLSDGSYLIPLLPIGPSYELEVEAPGFRQFLRTGIVLELNQNVRIDAHLQVSGKTESVQVNAQTPLIDTHSATGGEVVESKRMTELPLDGRNPIQLAGLVPGTTAVNATVTLAGGNRAASSMSVNGSRTNETDYQLNGIRFAGSYNNSGLNYPNPDALSEFKLVTNPVSAENGEYSGAVFSAVTKSGTNSFHGNVFEFLRNDALNARNYFASTVPALKQNQFGVTAGGPIIKNRLFWFGSYQGFRIRQDALSPSLPLTTDERNGLITSATPVIDPDTGLPFATNSAGQYVIPHNRLSPVTQTLLNKYVPAAPPGGVLQETGSNAIDVNQFAATANYNIRSSDQLYLSGLQDKTVPSNPFMGSFTDYGSINQSQTVRVLTASEIHSFGTHVINEFRLGFSMQREVSSGENQVSPDSLGMKNWNYNYDPDVHPQSPTFDLPGRFVLGSSGYAKWREGGRNWQFTDIVSISIGGHDIRTGIDFYHRQHYLDANIADTGDFVFGGSFTGSPLAEFLLGKPDNETRIFYVNHPGYKAWSKAVFFQDDWKVAPRLTLNLGMRYELLYPFHEYRAMSEANDMWEARGPLPISGGATYLPGAGRSTVMPYAPPGLLFPGDKTAQYPNGIPEALIGLDKSLIEPRLGLAWDPRGDGRTSVRASLGLFSNAQFVDLPAQVSQNLPFLAVQTIIQPPHDLTDPYNGLLTFPRVDTTNFTTNPNLFTPFLPVGGYGWDPAFRQPRIATITMNVQQQLSNSLMFQIGYVGKLSRHLANTKNINTAQKNIPGIVPSVANEQMRRLLDQQNFLGIDYEQSNENASYNALQTQLRYRSGALTLLAAYTWSHAIDTYSSTNVGCVCYQNPLNPRADRGSSSFDQRHVFVVSAVYGLPDPSKPLHNLAVSKVVGGWELSAISSAESGAPFSVFTGIDSSYTAEYEDRPNLIGNPYLAGNRSRAEKIAQSFNPNAFEINYGHFGNLGRNTFTNPGVFSTDMGLFKNIPISESTLQFRAEFFNAFNQTHLGGPISTLVSPAFGETVSAGDPRLIQFGLKFKW